MRVPFCANRLRSSHHLKPSNSVSQQCIRTLHLMYATKTKAPLGNHRIKDYAPVDFLKGLGEVRLQLWGKERKKSTIIEADIDLRSVLKKYIGPGIFLAPYDPFIPLAPRAAPPVCKEEKSAKDPNALPQYQLVPLKTTENKRRRDRKLPRGAMEYRVLPGKPSYFSLCMQKAFDNLKNRIRVEFHISLKHRQKKKHSSIPTDHNALREIVENNLHFHPHVITKAMPEFSGIIVDPQTNFLEFCWVIGPSDKMEDGGLKFPKNITKHISMQRESQLELDSQGRGNPSQLQRKEMRKTKRKENRKARNYLSAQKLRTNMGTGEGLETSRNIWKSVYK
jgi:hypothetical protein